MALIDAIMAGQQFVASAQQQNQAAREYRDKMALLYDQDARAAKLQDVQINLMKEADKRAAAGEMRAAAAERRLEELFPIEKALAEFGLAGGALGIQEIMTRLASESRQETASNDLEAVQRQIIQLQRIATQNPSAVTARMFNAVEESTYQLIQKYPPLAASIAPLYTSMVDAANLAIREGKPTQLTKEGAIETYKQKKTTVGREAGKVGSYGYTLPTGPNLRAGIPSRGLTGAEFVSRPAFESGLKDIRMDPSYKQAERTMESFPNFLSLVGSPYASALMSTVPNE